MLKKEPRLVINPSLLPGHVVFSQGNKNDTKLSSKEAKDLGETEAEITRKQGEISSNKLDTLITKASDILYKVKNVVPIFTAELIIDSSKVTVIHRPFFFSERIHSVSIQDISDVYIDTIPFLATVYIVDTGFVDNVVKVKWVWKPKAEKARRIITGLMEAAKEKIDITQLKGESLGERLEELGKVRQTSTTVSNV